MLFSKLTRNKKLNLLKQKTLKDSENVSETRQKDERNLIAVVILPGFPLVTSEH